jgi:DNA polymerase (family X)
MTLRSSNLEVARLFEQIAQSLELAGEQGHRPRAYRRAARRIAGFPEPLEGLAAEGRLRDIPSVGPSLAALIEEYLRTGEMRTHARLVEEHPPGLAPLLRAPGFGPVAVKKLYETLGVKNLDDVERAAREGRLAEALGARRADELALLLPQLRRPVLEVRLKSAWEIARGLVELLMESDAPPDVIEVAGAARRMCDIVADGLDLVAVPGPSGAAGLLDTLAGLPSVVEIVERDAASMRAQLDDGLEVRLHTAGRESFGTALVQHTGSSAHLRRLGSFFPTAASEHELYQRLDLPWIAPELREDAGEIEAARDGSLPRLVEQTDLRGDLHCHTNWTDGVATLEEMAKAAMARGYAYMALTDHSRSLAITNGLSLERLEEARRLVQQLNHTLAPFVILLGTEMDILEDGRLDYPDDVLASLDYVSASVHSRFKQTQEVMTARIVRAISNPRVHTLNHPHGRLLLNRPAYAVDMQHVVEAAARVGCALEVSADPARMDLDGGWARRARAAGARCTISSDAHSTLDYDNIWLGVGSARRGWIEARDVLNARPLEELRALLQRRVRTEATDSAPAKS